MKEIYLGWLEIQIGDENDFAPEKTLLGAFKYPNDAYTEGMNMIELIVENALFPIDSIRTYIQPVKFYENEFDVRKA